MAMERVTCNSSQFSNTIVIQPGEHSDTETATATVISQQGKGGEGNKNRKKKKKKKKATTYVLEK